MIVTFQINTLYCHCTVSLQHGATGPRQRGENPRNRGGHSGEERTGKKIYIEYQCSIANFNDRSSTNISSSKLLRGYEERNWKTAGGSNILDEMRMNWRAGSMRSSRRPAMRATRIQPTFRPRSRNTRPSKLRWLPTPTQLCNWITRATR